MSLMMQAQDKIPPGLLQQHLPPCPIQPNVAVVAVSALVGVQLDEIFALTRFIDKIVWRR